MATKTAVIQKKINDVVYDLMFKTTAANVSLEDGTTLDAKIEEISSYISKIVTENIIDSKISTASDNLYNKIMGISGSDVTINEAFDTIQEIAAWLENDGNETAASIVTDIATLQGKVTTLEQTATKVVKSDINGNIKVDGEEVVVYTHPDTHSADMIDETEERKFVSPTEKASWNAKSTITTGDTIPETMEENDYFLKTVNTVEVTSSCTNGTASKTTSTINSGSSIYVEFTPNEGYVITGGTVQVNGVDVSDYETDYTGKVAILLKNVTEATSINVAFAADAE